MNPIDKKISEFLKRNMPDESDDEIRAAGERVFQRLMSEAEVVAEAEVVEHVEQVQEQPATLTDFQHLTLTAAYLLRGTGRIIDIFQRVSDLAGTQVMAGRVYSTLHVLERRKLLQSKFEPVTRNGKVEYIRRFAVTSAGELALEYAKESSSDLLEDLT